MTKSILITGSNSGFGRLTAQTLARRGHTALATMRDIDGKNAGAARELRGWAEAENATLHVIELDVTDDASVRKAVQRALELAGHIDAVVNNAGTGSLGLHECYTPEQMRDLFEVNLFGVHRVNRAVLPHMRERRSGLLIHLSSSLGRMVAPNMGLYCASKWALEAMAEVYRYELATVGVDSVIVEPGAYPTEFVHKIAAPAEPERAQGYGENARLGERVMAALASMLQAPEPPDSQEVADAITALVEAPAGQRPLRTVVDRVSGDGPRALNQLSANIMSGFLQATGMGSLLEVKSS